MDTTQKRYLTPAQFADHLGVTRRTVYNLIERGEVPSMKVGGSVRIDMDRFLPSREEVLTVTEVRHLLSQPLATINEWIEAHS